MLGMRALLVSDAQIVGRPARSVLNLDQLENTDLIADDNVGTPPSLQRHREVPNW
jgi:hypothetical protein